MSISSHHKLNLRFPRTASDKVRLIVLAVIVGLMSGCAAALLKWLIGSVTRWLEPLRFTSGPDWTMLWLPVAGIALTGIYQRYILRHSISHGVDKLVDDLAMNRYDLSPRLTYAPIIASTFTLGFGGSAGSEGPVAYAGAAIGSNVGRIFGVRASTLCVLIGCGAGAGIAGIFKAPVGGALFTLEVLGMTMTTVSVIALLASTLSAALTAYVLSGCTPDLSWTHSVGFNGSVMVWSIALGVVCGLYSMYYSSVMKRMGRVYRSIGNPWVENIISGIVLAVSVFLFPSLYGEGYGVMDKVLNTGWTDTFSCSFSDISLLVILGGILLVKCFACSAANSGGGVAGDFAPTLFAGCICGLLFALAVNKLFGVSLPQQVFAFIGMSGVMAGVIRAPLMAIFLSAEMCKNYDYILPLVAVSLISYGMVMFSTGRKFYEAHSSRHKSVNR